VTAPAALEAAMHALDSAMDSVGGTRTKPVEPAPPLPSQLAPPGHGVPPALPDSGVYNAVPDPNAKVDPAAADTLTEVARPASLAASEPTPPSQ
jgi:hypothetical protein